MRRPWTEKGVEGRDSAWPYQQVEISFLLGLIPFTEANRLDGGETSWPDTLATRLRHPGLLERGFPNGTPTSNRRDPASLQGLSPNTKQIPPDLELSDPGKAAGTGLAAQSGCRKDSPESHRLRTQLPRNRHVSHS